MKVRDETPSFDFGDETASDSVSPPNRRPTVSDEAAGPSREAMKTAPPISEVESEWQEVPQALFLSWSPQMQMAYCAARDEDAALCGWKPTIFFIERAESYRCLSRS